jgi:molybdate transport system substrate-binding protein
MRLESASAICRSRQSGSSLQWVDHRDDFMTVRLLSGGAAQRLVQALAPRFKAEIGSNIDGTFGAVGAMRDKLDGGAPVDVLILTEALIAQLEKEGKVVRGSARAIGVVPTGIAVRADDPQPGIGDAAAVSDALLAADEVYVPDLLQSTAGIHFAKMLERLGIRAQLDTRLRVFPNGNTAMAALARAGGHPIGCTQVTEILATQGVKLVGPLPSAIGLSTTYTAGVSTRAASPDPARRLIELLAAAPERARFGFTA